MINNIQQLKATFLKLISNVFLILFLSILFSCNSTKNTTVNDDVITKKILKENRRSKKKYYVVKHYVIKEDKVHFVRYKIMLKGGLIPRFINGDLYKYVSVINNEFYFFDKNDENYNIQVLENMKNNLTEQENIDCVNSNYNYYKKGWGLY
ncbi:hypothetical protein [Flavobacterium beibuense]|uniref:Uncharacterized protein n=1 Tax=Flavobacterium beibuense TaxID=657326 RepID=A0A444W3U1_9FLAO|nr:hypothetical protein [Flavobacterium beibuense]RYJ40555.1 hypothetical protein NU09_3385 [Flavobacterium beibuense]